MVSKISIFIGHFTSAASFCHYSENSKIRQEVSCVSSDCYLKYAVNWPVKIAVLYLGVYDTMTFFSPILTLYHLCGIFKVYKAKYVKILIYYNLFIFVQRVQIFACYPK